MINKTINIISRIGIIVLIILYFCLEHFYIKEKELNKVLRGQNIALATELDKYEDLSIGQGEQLERQKQLIDKMLETMATIME